MNERIRKPESRAPGTARRLMAFVSNAILLFCLSPVSAAVDIQFGGGTGEPNDPYRIATAEQLISIGEDPNLLNRHFVLVSDIDLYPGLPGGKVFTKAVIAPSSKSPFTGSLDGADHAIRNLTINGIFNTGLFGYVALVGTVKNLGVENVSIIGSSRIGGLVASNNGTVSLCHSTGSVTGTGNEVGGLAGSNSGTITSCHSTVGVTGADHTTHVGGLAGSNQGDITSCYATGSVVGEDHGHYVGGLVGGNDGTVTLSYATCSVTGTSVCVGGLAGRNSGTLRSCYSTGSVTGFDTLGGLVGFNEIFSTLEDCSSTGDVTTNTDWGPGIVGGLAGSNGGTITSCHSTGRVTGWTHVGGLVGSNILFGTVIGCYSTGDVTGAEWGLGNVGGLVGYNPGGTVASCYSTGNVTGPETVGGLVGYSDGSVTSCYSTGSVTGWAAVGGLVGGSSSQGQIASSYFLAPSDGGGPDNGLGTALAAGQMRQQESFIGFDFWGSTTDGSSDDWFMPQDGPPVLFWQTDRTALQTVPDVRGLTPEEASKVLEAAGLVLAAEVQADYDRTIPPGHIIGTCPAFYAALGGTVELIVSLGPYDWMANPGDGTVARPYEIQDVNQLESLMDRPDLGGMHFVLTADIDLAGRTYSKALIAPDVDDSMDGFQGTAFTGSFDGQGFKILNLRITTRANDYLGLFGYIAKGATVTRVDLVAIRVQGDTASYYVGTVAGYNAGTIADCYVRGAVNGHSGSVGPLAGGNSGKIENCDAAVSGGGMPRPG